MAKGTNAKIKELKGIKPEKITEDQLKKSSRYCKWYK